jgi:hypothetical protein
MINMLKSYILVSPIACLVGLATDHVSNVLHASHLAAGSLLVAGILYCLALAHILDAR